MADSALSHHAEIVMGQSPPGEACNAAGRGLPLLNGPTEYGPHHPAPVQFTTDARKRAREGDILFCVRGSTTGRMNWADREYAIGRGVAAIRHKNRPELQPFVRAVIEHGLSGLLTKATGSTFPNVSANQLAGLWWPPLDEDEQRAIAHILGTLDDKIELNRRTNETLESIARALFKSWFVDFDPVRAKSEGRDPGLPAHLAELFPARLVASESGEIPEGWDARPLKEVLVSKDDRVGEADVPEYSSTNDGLRPRSELFDKQLSASKSKGKLIREGDLVFGLSRRVLNFGLMRDPVGCVSPAYRVFSVDRRAMAPDFLERMMRLRPTYFYKAVSSSSREGQSISSEGLGRLTIVQPTEAVQRAYYVAVGPILDRALISRAETRALAALRDTLLPKLISGALCVKNAERFLEAAT